MSEETKGTEIETVDSVAGIQKWWTPPADVDEARRAKLKEAATLRADFNWRTAMLRVDHKLEVIEPALKRVVQQISTINEVTRFEVEDEDSTG